MPNPNYQPPRWFELFNGQGLPHDREGGWRMIQREMCPLMAAMSIVFGRGYFTAEAARQANLARAEGNLICECCSMNLANVPHADDCELMNAALEIINGRPGTFDGQSNSDRKWFQRTYCRLPIPD